MSRDTSPKMITPEFVILGAGVIGLSTALLLRESYPNSLITILAAHFPGDYSPDYCSAWAGGNWCSSANDNGVLENCDRVTFHRFAVIAERHPEAGIKRSALRMIFDQKIEKTGILSVGTGKIWYEELVSGLSDVPKEEIPEGAVFGKEMESTFVINTQIYLQWLLEQCRNAHIKLIRRKIAHLDEAWLTPTTTALFNCTGLSSSTLPGVTDPTLYPTRGQTVLVSQPIHPLTKMYFRSPARVDNNTTYIFQRPLGGGVVLGGCREDGNWNAEPDMEFARDIMRRCCALAPELGRPEDLTVLRHGVGLRPGRKGGPRMEVEERERGPVVHNYGAGGAGYQGSWGMAAHCIGLYEARKSK